MFPIFPELEEERKRVWNWDAQVCPSENSAAGEDYVTEVRVKQDEHRCGHKCNHSTPGSG